MKKTGKNKIEIVIFDVDGVLVDVRGSFHRSTVQTVRHFTGKRVAASEIQRWKSKSGFNDDWKLSTAWIGELGGNATYEEVKKQFMKFYWGNGTDGNVMREEWLVPVARLKKWSRRAELALFTGRTRKELSHSLERFHAEKIFKTIVTMDDLTRLKPHPDGLLRILDGRNPESAVYLGDNVDDALASQAAAVPFLGVLPRNSEARRMRGAMLRKLGASAILHNVNELETWMAKEGQW
jgi:HAD superfamily hydrolase (TIGR01548 family)